MAKNLVIVESPAKAKTIEGFLGSDFVVKSSFGHIRDLSKGDKAIDIANNFMPMYEISDDKKAVVADLRKLSKTAETVWLATDEDREGEAISWHLYEALGLTAAKTKRIVFHEITKPAILKAVANPRTIDINLVNAQQARRILDRLVGFELSPVLWKKVKPSLSAGRVQSVAVRLIVEREREIDGFKITSHYKIVALFDVKSDKGTPVILKAELPKRFGDKDEASAFIQAAIGAEFTIKNLETKPSRKSPAAPFTTSTLQQEASRKLGFSVSQTMVVAQRLYESGKITYMRTDSVNLSDTALDAAKAEISTFYGPNYVEIRKYKTKSAGAQEAHEAIRPTYMNTHTVDGENNERRLYELIWKRTIASQMADAQLEKTVATIASSKHKEDLVANGEVIKFDGFLKVYIESTDDETEEGKDSGLLPPLTIGQKIALLEISGTQRFTHAAARYTEASLVKKLEELGIGRPSTYAPTISTVQKRGYVVKEDREGKERNFDVIILKDNKISNIQKKENTGAEKLKLFPTDIGAVVNDFLVDHFKNILDYNFTAKVEKEFDEIAQGQKIWNDMIKDFYGPFHKTVEDTAQTSERATGERILGTHPDNGKRISVRIGRYGPIVQIGEAEGEEKPQFASLRAGQRLESITFEDALELFKLPRMIGQYEDADITIAVGRFGPYARHKSAFYSLKKEDDPLTITLDRSIQLIEDKRKADSEKLIKSFAGNDEVQVLNGRWGPYIAVGKLNVKIPKDKDPQSLTLEECLALAKDHKPAKGKFVKKAAPLAEIKAIAKKPVAKKRVIKKK
jgi:DNA topoisomerase-1